MDMTKESPEATTGEPPRVLRAVGTGSIIFGILGGGLCWWLPLGMVFSITGLLLGGADWANARRHSLSYRLSVAGLAISAIALALDIVIAAFGLQTVTFGR